jgi:hypothetical protein
MELQNAHKKNIMAFKGKQTYYVTKAKDPNLLSIHNQVYP